MQRLHFLPRRAAQFIHVPLDRARHRVERNSHHAVQSSRYLRERRSVAQPHHHAVAWLLDPLHRNSLKCDAQRRVQLAQEKSPVAALQPQLVIVDNNDRIAHEKFHAALIKFEFQ